MKVLNNPGLKPKPRSKPMPKPLSKPMPKPRVPVNPGLVPKNDPFFKSKEFKDFEAKGGPATADMYNSPYFGSIGSGSVGRAKDEAYRKFKNIPDPTPPRQMMPPAGGVGNKIDGRGINPPRSDLAGLGSTGLGSTSPADGKGLVGSTGGTKIGSPSNFGMMKKGGVVKTASAPKASSASKRGDGCAQRGKTKGRMV